MSDFLDRLSEIGQSAAPAEQGFFEAGLREREERMRRDAERFEREQDRLQRGAGEAAAEPAAPAVPAGDFVSRSEFEAALAELDARLLVLGG